MLHYVEKLRVPVRFALWGESPVEGFFSLSPHAEMHAGPETLLERLNAPSRIVPVQSAEDGAVLLVNRAQLAWVEAGPDVAPMLVRPVTFMSTREERVRVRLAGGETLQGILAIEMPTEFNRASDFLNGHEDFFALALASGVRLINKSRLLDVRLLASASGPMEWPRAA